MEKYINLKQSSIYDFSKMTSAHWNAVFANKYSGYYMYIYVIYTDNYTSINQFYSIVTYWLIIHALILLLNCLVLMTLSLHTFSLSQVFVLLYLFIT